MIETVAVVIIMGVCGILIWEGMHITRCPHCHSKYLEHEFGSYWRCRSCGTVFDPDNLEDV